MSKLCWASLESQNLYDFISIELGANSLYAAAVKMLNIFEQVFFLLFNCDLLPVSVGSETDVRERLRLF